MEEQKYTKEYMETLTLMTREELMKSLGITEIGLKEKLRRKELKGLFKTSRTTYLVDINLLLKSLEVK